MPSQGLDLRFVGLEASRQVGRLAHSPQVARIQGLEADDVAQAATLDHEFHEFLVLGLIDARLGHPADLQRDQRSKQLLRCLEVGQDVVVDEEQIAPGLCFHLGNDLRDGAGVVMVVEEDADGAELASEPATPAVLEERERQVAPPTVDLATGEPASLRPAGGCPIQRSELASAGVGQDLVPEELGVALVNGVGVPGHLLWEQGGVHSSHHHRYTPTAVLSADFVGSPRRECLHGDTYQVGRLLVVDHVEPVVVHLHVNARRSQRRDHSQL